MGKINTPNKSFNDAWETLKLYHNEIKSFANSYTLELTNTPKFRNNDDWLHYISALQEVLVIGKRNNWIRTHVDGRGFQVWWLISIEIYEGKK